MKKIYLLIIVLSLTPQAAFSTNQQPDDNQIHLAQAEKTPELSVQQSAPATEAQAHQGKKKQGNVIQGLFSGSAAVAAAGLAIARALDLKEVIETNDENSIHDGLQFFATVVVYAFICTQATKSTLESFS